MWLYTHYFAYGYRLFVWLCNVPAQGSQHHLACDPAWDKISGFYSSILTEGTVDLRLGVDCFSGAFGRKVTVRSWYFQLPSDHWDLIFLSCQNSAIIVRPYWKSDLETVWIQAIGFSSPCKGNILLILEFKVKSLLAFSYTYVGLKLWLILYQSWGYSIGFILLYF